MTHEVVQRVNEIADRLTAAADRTEELGKLADDSVKLIREAGVMRLLQPTEYGGFAAHPRDFAEAVMATAKACGSTGWVCGVGGVHPWEMALMDRRLQDEVWADKPETWIASPYSPGGVAVPADGGYVLSGRWQFSSGTDHCDWIFLGALLGTPEGPPQQPPTMLHVVLPRSDYQIIDGSWDVIGLNGTGSKDVVVDKAFIPDYRIMVAADVMEGDVAAERSGRTETVYRLPFSAMFPLGITSAVIGIAEGALAANVDYQRDRVTSTGIQVRSDPYSMYSIAEAAAEISASRSHLIDSISRLYDKADSGAKITFEDRAVMRRNQIRCAWRAVSAVDEIFARSGGNVIRRNNPLQRCWRDAHVGLQHVIHSPGTTYHASALATMGLELEATLRPGLVV